MDTLKTNRRFGPNSGSPFSNSHSHPVLFGAYFEHPETSKWRHVCISSTQNHQNDDSYKLCVSCKHGNDNSYALGTPTIIKMVTVTQCECLEHQNPTKPERRRAGTNRRRVPYTLHRAPCAVRFAPCALHRATCTVRLAPCSFHGRIS